MQFWNDSNAFMAQAVAATGANADKIQFVPTPFTEDNALFAPAPLLWGFTPDLGPEDEVIFQRGLACDLQYPPVLDLLGNVVCQHASVGHPTVAGAQAISLAILKTL